MNRTKTRLSLNENTKAEIEKMLALLAKKH